jgi:pimeloyl-ACP methyl ester carboxylesterase
MAMPTFNSYDGTMLSYRVIGDGEPLVCCPGGPGRSVEYLGDLGGLSKSRRLVLLDPRGVGESADPADPASFGVDRLVHDVDALRVHLDLDRMDLLAHSAGSVLATLYAAAQPQRLSRLLLITPGLAATGVDITEEELRASLESRSTEPWYPSAIDAMERIMTGDRSMEAFHASRPFYYGRWDETARAHAAAGISERHQAAREGYFAGAAIDPPAIGAGLKKLTAPVLLYAGDLDPLVPPALVKQAASVFPDASVIVQGGAGHFPWIDDPGTFADNVAAFLS